MFSKKDQAFTQLIHPSKGLSISLNFRPYHDNDSSLLINLKSYLHQLLVLTGFRESISSQLRHLLIPPKTRPKRPPPPDLAEIMKSFPSIRSTPSYLIFSNGIQTIVMEKDRKSARILSSPDCITVTNHDLGDEARLKGGPPAHHRKKHGGLQMDAIIDESINRKTCMTKKWADWCDGASTSSKGKHASPPPGLEQLIEWVEEYPITNNMTHFSTIMDPVTGKVVWTTVWEPWESGEESSEVDEDGSDDCDESA